MVNSRDKKECIEKENFKEGSVGKVKWVGIIFNVLFALTFLMLALFIEKVPGINQSVYPTVSMYRLVFAFIGCIGTVTLALVLFADEYNKENIVDNNSK